MYSGFNQATFGERDRIHYPCWKFNSRNSRRNFLTVYNLLYLMRLLLSAARYGKRAVTFRHRLYAMAGQVVHYARQQILKVRPFRAILDHSDTPAAQIPDRNGPKNLYLEN